jgi:hypothetical protein
MFVSIGFPFPQPDGATMSDRTAPTRTLDFRWANEVVARPIDWLWQPWLARGTVAVLDGDPGVGKSSLALDLAARITTGKPFPGETASRDSAVAMILAMEDPLETVVKPRLEAASADMSRIALLGGVRENGPGSATESILQLPRDLDLIAEKCAQHRPALLIIDPLMAVLGLDQRGRFIKANDDQGVRKLTGQLKFLAERCNLVIWMLRHLNKGASGSALRRGSGTIAIAGQARSVMLAAGDPNDSTAHVLAMTKTNLAAIPPSWRFQLKGTGATSQVEWLGESELHADDLVQPIIAENKRADALLVAKDFLIEALECDGRPWEKLTAAAAGAGIAEITLRRAREALNLQKMRAGRGFVWKLPYRWSPN